MLTYQLIHPEILQALGRAGHGAQVLISDGNYPSSTASRPNVQLVYLNLAPGLLRVTDVLTVLVDAIPIEAAKVMLPADGKEPAIYHEFRDLLGDVELEPVGRFEFYEAARSPDLALVIATGEQRVYANILLTIGVVPPV
jgi:L-fucose mutarotase